MRISDWSSDLCSSDLETYVVTVVATMVLATIVAVEDPNISAVVMYPLALGGSCILATIIGTFFVKLGASQNIMGALYKGFIASAVLSAIVLDRKSTRLNSSH